jgi:medium-chain acyl-[acyl-carrier-protein] hydrolase
MADALVMATYTYVPGLALDCPITVIGGSHDPVVSRQELAEWRRQTRGDFRLRTLPGDHFLVRDASPEGTQAIAGGSL